MSSTPKSFDEANAVMPTEVPLDKDFYFPDGNICLLVGMRRMFCIHRYKLGEFLKLRPQIEGNKHLVVIQLPNDNPDDLHNAFKVVYTCPYALQPPTFDISVLVSTLRIATKYQNNALRNFAIHQLDLKDLSIIERIPIAREFNIEEWEAQTIQNLILRPAPVTFEEAEVLGIKDFFRVAAQRELNASTSRNVEGAERDPLGVFGRPSGQYRARKRLAPS
ncbi:hypothetical protein BDV93DRAFT_607705 [Ceratobasidium sp. AG-I]|nr:hypothetical protein BDV93DRAFT_607705 [Ceratobasidium sp. AG-I]